MRVAFESLHPPDLGVAGVAGVLGVVSVAHAHPISTPAWAAAGPRPGVRLLSGRCVHRPWNRDSVRMSQLEAASVASRRGRRVAIAVSFSRGWLLGACSVREGSEDGWEAVCRAPARAPSEASGRSGGISTPQRTRLRCANVQSPLEPVWAGPGKPSSSDPFTLPGAVIIPTGNPSIKRRARFSHPLPPLQASGRPFPVNH